MLITSDIPYTVHFFPFFFLLFPPCAGAGAAGIREAVPLSSFTSVSVPSILTSSSASSGKPAISLPSRDKLKTKRPTSAALSVLYLSVVPETGSYVFKVRFAFPAVGIVAIVAGSDVVVVFDFLVEGAESVYLVVMRA